MTRRLSLVLVSLITLSMILLVKPTHAAGMTVSPTFIKLSVSDQKTTSSDTIAIKNNGSSTVSYKTSIVDVDTETGTLLPLSSTSELTTKIFKISTTEFSLQPDQSINVTVTAQNLKELPPGGHYGALHIQQFAGSKTDSAVPINQVVGVGLFLVKEDGAVRDLSYTLSDQKHVWFTVPKAQRITVKNNGNVDVVPRGFVVIARGTKSYQKTLFNEISQPVFPGKSKEYLINFGKNALFWPGRYTKIISLRYDGQSEQQLTYATVWYVPLWSIFVVSIFGVSIYVLLKTRIVKQLKRKKLAKQQPISGRVVSVHQSHPNAQGNSHKAVVNKISDIRRKTKNN